MKDIIISTKTKVFFLIDIGYDDLLLVLKYFLSAGFFLIMDLLSDIVYHTHAVLHF